MSKVNRPDCSICLEPLENPKSLYCGHSYCSTPRTCLKQVLSNTPRRCARCRKPIDETIRNEADLSVNFDLESAFEVRHLYSFRHSCKISKKSRHFRRSPPPPPPKKKHLGDFRKQRGKKCSFVVVFEIMFRPYGVGPANMLIQTAAQKNTDKLFFLLFSSLKSFAKRISIVSYLSKCLLDPFYAQFQARFELDFRQILQA